MKPDLAATAYLAAAPATVPIPEHPDEPKRRKKRARHEAGHAVGLDEYGWETLSINISKTNGKPWKVETKRPQFDPAEAEVKLFEIVISVVAGPVAEKQLDAELGMVTRLVCEMVTDGNLDGSGLKCEFMDVAQTLTFLREVGQCTRGKILEAQERAKGLLAKRNDHLDELTKQVEEHHDLEALAIRKALGKEAAG